MSNSIKTKAQALINLIDYEVIEYAFYLNQLDIAVEFVDTHIDEVDEFYSPESDEWQLRSPGDTRKPKLTLEQLNKLRKVREIKKAEQIEHDKFVRTMYAQPAQTEL